MNIQKNHILVLVPPALILIFGGLWVNLPSDPSPSEFDGTPIVQIIGDSHTKAKPQLDTEGLDKLDGVAATFLTFYHQNTGTQSQYVEGAQYKDINIMYQALSAKTLGKPHTTIRVDFLYSSPLTPKKPTTRDVGLYGLKFGHKSNKTYVTGNHLLDWNAVSSKKKLKLNRISNKMKEFYTIDKDTRDLIKSDTTPRKWLAQTSYLYENGKVKPLYRGHRVYDKLHKDTIAQAIAWSENYLLNAVQVNGKLNYQYSPHSDKIDKKYNILRHAGTLYSMLELQKHKPSPELWQASKSVLAYLRTRLKPCPPENPNQLCIIERGHTKIGGLGLSLLAYSYYLDIEKNETLMAEGRKIAARIMSMMKPTSEFRNHKETYPGGQDTGFISGYYPGEAIYGLASFFRHTKNEALLTVAEKASLWIATVRDKEKDDGDLAHDHWLLYGMNELNKYRQNKDLMNHTTRLLEAILADQKFHMPYQDWQGGFRRNPTSASTATTTEGMLAGYETVVRNNLDVSQNKLAEAIKNALRVQLAAQLTPERVLFVVNPEKSLGGFGKTAAHNRVRIDFVQHNLSALIRALPLFEN